MVVEVVRAFFSVVRSPFLILPVLLAGLANVAVVLAFAEPLENLLVGVATGVLQESSGGFSFAVILGSYATEIGALALVFFLVLAINGWLGLVLGRFAFLQEQKRLRVSDAVRFGFLHLRRLISWSIFVFLLALAFMLFFLGVVGIGSWNWLVGFVLFLLLVVGLLVTGFVLQLGVPVMAIEDVDSSLALKKSVNVLKTKTLSFLALMLVLLAIVGVLNMAANSIVDAVEDENWVLVISVVFWIVQVLVVNLSLPFFYLNQATEGLSSA